MDMQQIELVLFGHLRHARRERQAVGRVLKERVVGDFDLVVEDVGPLAEANGIRVGDEMDLVAAVGQLQAKLGGDDAAAAISRVTGDTDAHVASVAGR